MQLNKNIAVSENGFIFNPVSGDSFSTNPIGQEIIRLMKDQKDRKEITKILADKYAADDATIEKDLSDFFQMLLSYQLINDHE
ncbi:MAG: HPr-rel-A system PqqD family protein [Bacteroidetes bacterium B1(2017)]|nr:MAG: HPr-rel-A system PqqD family protein [Bacteroidetes bacterium B1(2017)]